MTDWSGMGPQVLKRITPLTSRQTAKSGVYLLSFVPGIFIELIVLDTSAIVPDALEIFPDASAIVTGALRIIPDALAEY